MSTVFEIIVGLGLLGILGLLFNPTQLLMPESLNAMLILGLVVAFLGFAGLIWKEKAEDERESLHIQKAARLSFFVGTTVLVAGIAVQAFQHHIDPWLLLALSAMVIAKLLSRLFHTLRN